MAQSFQHVPELNIARAYTENFFCKQVRSGVLLDISRVDCDSAGPFTQNREASARRCRIIRVIIKSNICVVEIITTVSTHFGISPAYYDISSTKLTADQILSDTIHELITELK